MHYVRFAFNTLNYIGYCFWSFSTITFLEQLLNNTFNYKNINSFLSCLAAVVALFFAVFKLIAYVRDSKTRSKLLEQELIAKENDNFYKKWNHEFEEHKYDNNKTSNP